MYIIPIFIVLIIIVILISNQLYKKTNAYHNSNIMHSDFQKKHLERVIVLGSTYARYAFEGAKSLRLNVSNFTMRSQSLYNDYKNFRSVKSKLKEDSIVFIVLAPCTLLYEGNKSKIMKFKIPGNSTATLKQKIDYIFPIWNIKRIFSLLFDERQCSDIYDGKNLINDKDAVDTEMKKLISLWQSMFGLEGFKKVCLSSYNKKCIQKNVCILEKIIIKCIENNCKPILLTVPFSSKLNNYFSDEFINCVLEEHVDYLKNKYPQVQYLNYRKDKLFQDDIGLFMDGGFLLNRRGSQIFLRKLLKEDLEI